MISDLINNLCKKRNIYHRKTNINKSKIVMNND